MVHVRRLLAPAVAAIDAAGEAEVQLAGRSFRIRKQLLEDLAIHSSAERISALRKALLIFHSPRDGLCGDTSRIAHVLTRDERSAACMAHGYARTSGGVAVCEGPSGGGATYILPEVAKAESRRGENPAGLRPALRSTARHHGPTPVDVVTQPLHLARTPASSGSPDPACCSFVI